MSEKYSIPNIALKGICSSALGMPISIIVNLLSLSWIIEVANTYNYFFASLIIAAPFMITSAIRISVIDIIYQKYNIDLNPAHLIKRIISAHKK